MTKLRQAVQLALGTTMSNRAIGREVDMSFNSIRRYRQIIETHEYVLDALLALDDDALHARFYPRPARSATKRLPDWSYVHAELQRPHVTRQLLWEEYRRDDPDSAYEYSQFTHLYRAWTRRHAVSMRQPHTPGERGWVDFLGPTMGWVDPATGEMRRAQIFAAALGVSHLLFASAVPSQATEWWIEVHNRWYAFLGGVPAITVPDNLKAAVLRAGNEPQLNPTYLEMARHYGTVILPARSRKPKDKAKAEGGVLIIERWALARLRHRVFHSLAEINDALRECIDLINGKVTRTWHASRRARFEELDRPHLLPLPGERFEYGEWIPNVRVGVDYHPVVKGHHYSVPYRLVREQVDVRLTATMVEIFYRRQRIAMHPRSEVVGETTSDKAHLSPAHRAWSDQTPQRYRAWAITLGPYALEVIEHQFATARHVTLALRACSGLEKLTKTYGPERFEAACGEALKIKSPTLKSIRSLLQNHLEHRGRSRSHAEESPALPAHRNVRGPHYYSQKESDHAE